MKGRPVSQEAIMKAIGKELRKACEAYVGKEMKPRTPEEMKKDLHKGLQKYYNAVLPEGNAVVTPTDNPTVFDVSFQLPVYRTVLDLSKLDPKVIAAIKEQLKEEE